jgi:hypothetical protein
MRAFWQHAHARRRTFHSGRCLSKLVGNRRSGTRNTYQRAYFTLSLLKDDQRTDTDAQALFWT